ncbi:MAG: TolC family protein [Balneolales bacterium]
MNSQLLRFSACLMTLFFISLQLAAQQSNRISMDEAIRLALENNIQVKLSQYDLDSQQINVFQSKTAFLPSLSTSISSARTVGRHFDESTVSFDDIASTNMSAGLSTSITLYSGRQNVNNLRASESQLSASADDTERIRETVMLQTAEQFLSIIQNEELLKAAEDNLETSRRQMELIEAQVERGIRSIVELYTQQAELANSQVEVMQRRNALSSSKDELIGTLQMDPYVDYEFVSPGLDDHRLLEPVLYDLTDLIRQAMTNRRDLRATEASIQSQRYSLESAKGAYLPSITLGSGLSSSYFNRQQFPFADQLLDANINRRISLSVSIPIFNGFESRSRIQQSEINFKRAQLQMEDLRNEVLQQVRQAHNDYLTQYEQLETRATQEYAAEKAYEMQQEFYNAGSTSFNELILANNRYVNAVSDRIQTHFQYLFQRTVLDYYLGEISADSISESLE